MRARVTPPKLLQMAARAEYVSFLGVQPTANVMFSLSCKGRRWLVDQLEDLRVATDRGSLRLRVALWIEAIFS